MMVTRIKNECLNGGIEVLGKENVMSLFMSFYNHYRLECVSVGSGVAIFEADCLQANDHIIFHLVDPDYLSFIRLRIPKPSERTQIIDMINSFALKPDYPLVTDLVCAKPQLVSNSTMLLNWCNPGIDYYDYEAIKIMEPVGLFIIYGQDRNDDLVIGPAGSYKFQLFCKYMNKNKKNNSLRRPFVITMQEEQEIMALASQYKVIYSSSCDTVFQKVPMVIKMAWLQRRDRPIIFLEPEIPSSREL